MTLAHVQQITEDDIVSISKYGNAEKYIRLQSYIERPRVQVLQHECRALFLVLHAQQILGHVRLVLGTLHDESQQEVGSTEWHGDIGQSDRLFVCPGQHHLVEQRAVELLFLSNVVLVEDGVEKFLVFGANVVHGLEGQEPLTRAH